MRIRPLVHNRWARHVEPSGRSHWSHCTQPSLPTVGWRMGVETNIPDEHPREVPFRVPDHSTPPHTTPPHPTPSPPRADRKALCPGGRGMGGGGCGGWGCHECFVLLSFLSSISLQARTEASGCQGMALVQFAVMWSKSVFHARGALITLWSPIRLLGNLFHNCPFPRGPKFDFLYELPFQTFATFLIHFEPLGTELQNFPGEHAPGTPTWWMLTHWFSF